MMCDYCEPPYTEMWQESEGVFGETDHASYRVYPDMDGEPMLLVSAYNFMGWASGFVPINNCPMCGRDLKKAVTAE